MRFTWDIDAAAPSPYPGEVLVNHLFMPMDELLQSQYNTSNNILDFLKNCNACASIEQTAKCGNREEPKGIRTNPCEDSIYIAKHLPSDQLLQIEGGIRSRRKVRTFD
jgi:hypothetical protein